MIFFEKEKTLKSILDYLKKEESQMKRIGNFMHDHCINKCCFGQHYVKSVKTEVMGNADEKGESWIMRAYGFELKNSTARFIINEFLYMREEIERLEKLVEKNKVES